MKRPFFFLLTGDEFLRRAKIESLLNELVPSSVRQTNLSRWYGSDLDWFLLFEQARTPSLMGHAQVFWISEADEIKKSDWGAFESYCLKPAPESFFIFESDDLSDAHPLVKLSERLGQHLRFSSKSAEGGTGALKAKLKRFGKTMTHEAWGVFEDRLGASMRLMDAAIDQLILYSEGPTIDERMVEKLTKEFLQYEPFDLTEALACKNTAEALRIFRFFYDLNGDLPGVVGLIHWQLKRIWQAKRMLNRGSTGNEISRSLRIPPSRIASFLNQVKRFDLQNLEKLLEDLWQLDWNVKRGLSEDLTSMEKFLAGVA